MTSDVGIAVNVLVELKEGRHGGMLAFCPFLNVMSQGDSEDSAIAQLRREIEYLISVCLNDGTLEAMLERRIADRYEPFGSDDSVRSTRTYIDLPSEFPPDLLRRFSDAAASAA